MVMGFTLDWLPSLKSDESHLGAFVILLSGQVRLGRFTPGKGLLRFQLELES